MSEPWFKLLGIKIDKNLNFDLHIKDLFKAAYGQLNPFCRLKSFLDFKAEVYLCKLHPVNFSSSKSLQKIESIQKRALRFLYSDYESDHKTLLTKTGIANMNVYRLKVLCTEIYKSLNSFSPDLIKDIFKPNTSSISLRTQQQ